MRRLSSYVTLLVMCLPVACGASAPVPAGQVTETQAAIRAAQEAGAPSVPKAALHLKMAEDQLKTARDLMELDDNQMAQQTLDRARADAELALSVARGAAIRQKTTETLDKIRNLREEVDKTRPEAK